MAVNSARRTSLLTCCVTRSKFIHPSHKYFLSIYYRHCSHLQSRWGDSQRPVNTAEGGEQGHGCRHDFHPCASETPRTKDRKGLVPIKGYLRVATGGRSTLSEICGPARVARASTWCSSHCPKYSCSYYSTLLSHLLSHVWG